MPSDPFDDGRKLAQAAVTHAPDLALLLAGLGAALIRLLVYSGPPRPLRPALVDALAQFVVAFGVGEMALGITNSLHAGLGFGLLTGLVGWPLLQRIASRHVEQVGKP